MDVLKVYRGYRHIELHNNDASKSMGVRGICEVTVNEQPLKSVNKIKGYAEPFEWGCINSASTNLAESILSDYLNMDLVLEELYIPFRNEVVAYLGLGCWQIEEWQLNEWLQSRIQTLQESMNGIELVEEEQD